MRLLGFLSGCLCALLTACKVGPNFHSPASPPTNQTYIQASPTPKKTISAPAAGKSGIAQHFVYGKDISATWWEIFHSPELNAMIQQGLRTNPNLAAAMAALIQAHENYRAQIGSTLYPALNMQLGAARQRFNSSTFGNDIPSVNFNLFNFGFSSTYTLDFFGGLRRQIEALGAQLDYQVYQLEVAYLTLTANIVTTSIAIASFREQIKATHDLIRAQEQELVIVTKQYRLGGASLADVLAQQTQVSQTKATLPPLEQNLAQNFHALSALIGKLPTENALPQFNLDQLNLPSTIPVSLPSFLIRQRPDIRASEALLHVASAQIGVATANLFPQFTINAAYGWQNSALGPIFHPSNVVWSYGSNILQPLFNGGALLSRRRAAIAAYDQACAQYRQTVLQAFQNVADILRALQHDAQALKIQREAEIAAKDTLRLVREQFRLGGTNYINLLIAEKAYQQTRIARIQAQAARYTDSAGLFQALGGGWWNRKCCEPVRLAHGK